MPWPQVWPTQNSSFELIKCWRLERSSMMYMSVPIGASTVHLTPMFIFMPLLFVDTSQRSRFNSTKHKEITESCKSTFQLTFINPELNSNRNSITIIEKITCLMAGSFRRETSFLLWQTQEHVCRVFQSGWSHRYFPVPNKLNAQNLRDNFLAKTWCWLDEDVPFSVFTKRAPQLRHLVS